jgi:peptide chain release factor subunit 3
VTLLPQRTPISIKEIYNAKDQRLPFACAGENLKLKVKGVDEDEIGRGDVICNNLNYCQESSEFKASVTIL